MNHDLNGTLDQVEHLSDIRVPSFSRISTYICVVLGRLFWFLAFRGYHYMTGGDISLLRENALVEKMALIRQLGNDHPSGKGDHFKRKTTGQKPWFGSQNTIAYSSRLPGWCQSPVRRPME